MSEEICRSLNGDVKFIPLWFRYDKQGSIYNDLCLTENKFYYMHRCEEEIFSQYVEDIVGKVSPPWILADMGSGNGVKTRKLLDVMTTKSSDIVHYIPIDISEECLSEMAAGIVKDYAGKVSVEPIAGDYSKGIECLRGKTGNKLILWLGGFQNMEYSEQIGYMSKLAAIMTESDRLVLSLDITRDKEQVENAYLDPTAGLGMTLRLDKGENIRLSDGKGTSCKYTMDQVAYLARASGTEIADVWTDKERHVGIFSFKVV